MLACPDVSLPLFLLALGEQACGYVPFPGVGQDHDDRLPGGFLPGGHGEGGVDRRA